MKNTFRLIALSSWLATGLTAACSNSKSEVAPSSDSGKKDKAKAGAGDDGDDLGTGDDSETGTGSSFSGCGINSFSDASKTFSQSIASANIPYHGSGGTIFGGSYTIQVKGTVGLEASVAGVKTTNNFDIIRADPQSAANKAQDELKKVIGTRQATVLSASAWKSLTQDTWQGITCGAFPVSSVQEQTGTHQTTVNFDPPLPYFVSPLMTKARFEKEFPEERSFPGIKATVVTTNNEKLQTGQVVTGTAYIRPIPAETVIVENDGSQVKVEADYAFRLDFDFGDFERTSALGLNKLSTYYVKDGKFFAVSIETGITQAPTIHYTK